MRLTHICSPALMPGVRSQRCLDAASATNSGSIVITGPVQLSLKRKPGQVELFDMAEHDRRYPA